MQSGLVGINLPRKLRKKRRKASKHAMEVEEVVLVVGAIWKPPV
jgi:hypothetical protein